MIQIEWKKILFILVISLNMFSHASVKKTRIQRLENDNFIVYKQDPITVTYAKQDKKYLGSLNAGAVPFTDIEAEKQFHLLEDAYSKQSQPPKFIK